MHETLTPYVDGWWGGETETTVRPEPRFPFKAGVIRPDVYTRAYDREYVAYPGGFVPKIDRRTTWENVLKQSETLADTAAWTLTNATVVEDEETAPDGEETMDAVKELAATGEHSIAQAATVTAAPWEFSIFAKAGLTRSFIRVAFTDSAAVVHSVFFDVAAGRVGTESNATGKVINLGRGDICCVLRCTPAAGAGTFKVNIAASGSSISYLGNVTNGMYLWGAQAALGVDAPYIPTTDAARTISAPDRDPLDPMAYLIRELDPITTSSEMLKIRRTFSRIPRPQIQPNSQWVKKPELTGTFPQVLGDAIIIQPEAGVPRWIFYTNIPITSDSGVPATTVTGGTFTLTFNGDTTSGIAYNASASAVQSALNALTSVTNAGGVTVTGSHTAGYVVTFASYAAASVNATSLVADYATVAGTVSVASAGKIQTVSIKPTWTPASPSAASSFTPAAANPISWGNVGAGFMNIGWYIGNQSIFGAPATGGTYTITLFGQTTAAINFDASNATISAAVNALSEVTNRGGYTVRDITFNAQPGKVAEITNNPAISSGTFTLTVLGQTTAAIAYNASLSTIQSAINALGNVTARGGVVVSGAGFASGQINFVITFNNIPAMTGSPASLVPSGSNMSVSTASSDGRVQNISFSLLPSTTRELLAANHGVSAPDSAVLTIGGAFITIAPGQFSVPNSGTILLTAAALVQRAGTYTGVGSSSGKVYTADNKYTRVKRSTRFYLLGVSTDDDGNTIESEDDIPLPDYQGDPASLLSAIFAGSTAINLEVGELELYEDGPICERTVVLLNAATL